MFGVEDIEGVVLGGEIRKSRCRLGGEIVYD